MKVKLTRIFTEDKVSPKTGKAYTSMSIKTEEHGDVWIKGFQGKENVGWREGDEVEVNIDTVESNGKTYYNFSVPKSAKSFAGGGATMKKLDEIYAKLEEILEILRK